MSDEIRYIKNADIDKTRWDEIIDNAPNGLVYAYSWLLDALTDNQWNALVLGDYEFVMPLPWRCKYGIYYLSTPLSVQQLGIYSLSEVPDNLYYVFLKEIPTTYKYINLNINCDEVTLPKDFEITRRTNFILDINRSYEEIRKGYKENAIRILKKDNDFTFEYSVDFQKIVREFATRFISNVRSTDILQLKQAFDLASKKNKLKTCLLKDNLGNTMASAIFLLSHKRAYYMMSLQSTEGKARNAIYFLFDKFIQDNCQSIKIFDFEGSDIPGVAEFFKKWGSTPEYYTNIKYFRFPVNLFKSRF